MLRRDYILRMVEEFVALLSRLQSYKRGQEWREATETLDEALRRLLQANREELLQWSETELLARLIQGEPTLAVREKSLLLTSLLKEAGEIAAGQGRHEEGRAFLLKGLTLLLGVLASGDTGEFPEFVPRVEGFLAALGPEPLPLEVQARLMQHYERNGEFGKAEDVLFGMLEAAPHEGRLVEFGLQFYERVGRQSDGSLAAGNLPRSEVEAGKIELRRRGNRGAWSAEGGAGTMKGD